MPASKTWSGSSGSASTIAFVRTRFERYRAEQVNTTGDATPFSWCLPVDVKWCPPIEVLALAD